MRKYTVTAVAGFAAGAVLGLSDRQAAPRAHALKPLKVDKKAGFGLYETTSRVEFKVGEVIATDMELSKHMLTLLEPVEDTAARERAAAASAAAAKDLAQVREKAARWDEFQAQIDEAQAKCAAFDSLPEDVRTAALASVTRK